MSAREMQSRLTSTWKSGKDGYVAAINESAVNYAADTAMLPSEFGELSSKQAVANYGGYLVAHKGVTAEYVFGFANAIAKKYNEIDNHLSDSTESVKALLVSLDDQLSADNANTAEQNLLLGDTGERLAKSLTKTVDDLVSSMTVTRTPKMEFAIRDAIRKLEASLPADSSAVQTTRDTVLV